MWYARSKSVTGGRSVRSFQSERVFRWVWQNKTSWNSIELIAKNLATETVEREVSLWGIHSCIWNPNATSACFGNGLSALVSTYLIRTVCRFYDPERNTFARHEIFLDFQACSLLKDERACTDCDDSAMTASTHNVSTFSPEGTRVWNPCHLEPSATTAASRFYKSWLWCVEFWYG